MTDPKGNSEFCSPRPLMFPKAKLRGTLRAKGKQQNSKFAKGSVISVLLYLPALKLKKKM